MDTRTIELRLDAGRLILASDAVQGIFHVQDPITRQFMPMLVARPVNAAAPRRWAFSGLRGPVLGALVGAAAIGLLGLSSHWWVDKPMADKQRAVAGLPMAKPTAKSASADGITVVDAAWSQPASQTTSEPPAGANSGPLMGGGLPPSLSAPPTLPAASAATAAPASAPAPALPPATARPAATPAAPVRSVAESKAITAPDKKSSAPAASDKTRDESPVVFNELAPARALASDAPARAPAAAVLPIARASAPRTGNGGVRLVAVKDASTILVGLPGQLVPVQLKPGSRLPNGATIVSADPARGVVLLDNGTSLALE
ncbi:MAG: hypothetical protein HYX47_13180 [Burkholderiales bacterium]|nr:hypothetical protein [Burkholderiales bacterium]